MIDEKELERMCRLAGLMKITTAKLPTYRTKDGTAGIELTKDGLKAFYFVDGERNYDMVMDDLKICSVLGAFEAETSKYEPILDEKTKEKVGERLKAANVGIVEDTTSIELGIIKHIPAVLDGTRIIIPSDLNELKQMSTFDRMLLFQKTDKRFVEKRRGFLLPSSAGKDKKTLTDADYKMFSYVEGNVMKMEANLAFLFEWSAEVQSEKWFDNQVVVRGYLEVEINGKLFRRPCGGAGVKKNDVQDWGDVLETAITEMIKRGLKSFGFNGDVYRGEV